MIIDKSNKLDKAFENKSSEELVSAPADALQGVSEKDAEKLKRSFKIETIEDMAKCEWYLKALAIKAAVEGE